MAVITIGPGTSYNTATSVPGYTQLLIQNPANASGKLISVELRFGNAANGVYVATFYGSGANRTARDYAYLGNLSSGLVTVSGLDIDVRTGDVIGVYHESGGGLRYTSGTEGATNAYYVLGNACDAIGTQNTYISNKGFYAVGGSGFSTTITAGPGAIDRANAANPGYTWICLANPANASGKFTAFKLYVNSAMSDVVVGTLYGNGTSYQSRDHHVIGSVSATGLQTFSGLDVDVVVGDYVGLYWSAGNLDFVAGTGTQSYFWTGNAFGQGVKTFATNTGIFSIEATGEITVLGVGPGAWDRSTQLSSGMTIISLDNQAVMAGTINEVQLWASVNITGAVVCLMHGSGTSYTVRENSRHVIGSVTAGAKRTFSGLSLPVYPGDFIAIYYSGGDLEADTSTNRNYNKSGDQTSVSGLITGWGAGSDIPSIFATGSDSGWANIQIVDGVLAINIAAVNGVLADNTATISLVPA